jgi:hypothetical protein
MSEAKQSQSRIFFEKKMKRLFQKEIPKNPNLIANTAIYSP